jgi:hypothetical protein
MNECTGIVGLGIDGTASPPVQDMSDREILALWAGTMTELQWRGILRSDNSPTGDYAEWIVSQALGLKLEGNSTAGYDAVGPDGMRYQIKARRLMTAKTSRQLSAIRNLDKDPFDYLIIVLFGPTFDVLECWQVPVEVVREHAVWTQHVNGHRLHARGAVLSDPRTIRLTVVEEWSS